LEGAPGTGKTEVLVKILEEFQAPLIVTYVGMMVDALQKRFGGRVETANTIHFITYVQNLNDEEVDNWLSNFDLIVIDEGSNVDSKLFCRLLKAIPNATRLLICGDLGQIYPIKPGCPFSDLSKRYPDHTFCLVENKRVDKDSLLLAESCTLIRQDKTQQICFDTEALQFLERKEDQEKEEIQNILFKQFKITRETDIMDFQIVVLTNNDRFRMNQLTEKLLLEEHILRKTSTTKVGYIEIFKGKKIQFTKNTKPKEGDPVKNGELGQILSFKKHKDGVLVYLINNKTIFFHTNDGVDPTTVIDGYASTCNKAQGSEWKFILFNIYSNPYHMFTKEYPYVAISRAKKKCVIIADKKDVFYELCKYKAKERKTILQFYLKDPSFDLPLLPYSHIPLKDPKTLSLLPPDKKAVPILIMKEKEPKNKLHKTN
jgi:exodeoxyribonuclease V alpha subunit